MALPTSAPDAQIRVRNRETGEVFPERVFGGSSLRFLYDTTRGRLLTEAFVSRSPLNHLYGWLKRSGRTRAEIPRFIADLGIDPAEADLALDEYDSLDAFFARRLRPGARPVDADPDHLVSPCDGRLLVMRISEGQRFRVKGHDVDLPELLGDPALARQMVGGEALVFRLAPADYHRYHFPADGVAGSARRLGHRLHSVHPIALSSGAPSFRNKRDVASLHTERFGDLCMVEVGAMLVGVIAQTYRPGPVRRGQEKGLFRFGGSTVVLLVPPGTVRVDEDLEASSREGIESQVRMGTRVARAIR